MISHPGRSVKSPSLSISDVAVCLSLSVSCVLSVPCVAWTRVVLCYEYLSLCVTLPLTSRPLPPDLAGRAIPERRLCSINCQNEETEKWVVCALCGSRLMPRASLSAQVK